jgi:ribose 1,5-bisphosphokinase PhnN
MSGFQGLSGIRAQELVQTMALYLVVGVGKLCVHAYMALNCPWVLLCVGFMCLSLFQMCVVVGDTTGSVGKASLFQEAQRVAQRSPYYSFAPVCTTKDEKLCHALSEQRVSEEEWKQTEWLVSWKDKTTQFGISSEVLSSLENNIKTIIILPHTQLAELAAKIDAERFPTTIIHVTGTPDILAERRAKTKDEQKKLSKKLKKQTDDLRLKALPQDEGKVVDVWNDATIKEAALLLLGALGFNASVDIPPPDENDLQNCLPQDYLKRVVFPYLAPALSMMERIRPADPVNWLALQLYKDASETKSTVAELTRAKQMRLEIRRKQANEFAIEGRI